LNADTENPIDGGRPAPTGGRQVIEGNSDPPVLANCKNPSLVTAKLET
jgi:hypothetical protein